MKAPKLRTALTTLVVVAMGAPALAGQAQAATGELAFQGCVKDTTGTTAVCAETNPGLASVNSVTVSPDGESAYAAGLGDDTVAMFNRNPATGALTSLDCVSDADNFPASGCADFQEGLDGAFGVAVSPDGLDVYVAAETDDAVVHLERDPDTGDLNPVGCVGDTGDFAGCGGATQAGLNAAKFLVVSPDGSSVYVAAGANLVRLVRNPMTGAISPGSCAGADVGCTAAPPGLGDLYDIALSADGTSLHVVGRNPGTVVSLGAPGLGTLGCFVDTDNPPIAGCTPTQGLAGARGIAVSPDGKSAYAVSGANSAIVQFGRVTSGVLTPVACIGDAGTTACPTTQEGLGLGADVVVSPDNASVYSVGDEHAIVRFDRNQTSGSLTPQGCISQAPDGTGCPVAVEGLFAARGVAASADGKSVYVASSGQAAVTHFTRETMTTPPVPPSNEFSFRKQRVNCKAACKKLKVKIEFPTNPGRAAICTPPQTPPGVVARICPGGDGPTPPSSRLAAKRKKLIKTKAFDVAGGPLTVSLKTTKTARKKLAKKGKLKLKLQLDFQPDGGTTRIGETTIKVKRKR
jgi:DNA-binding beta-propeller fold protein YncE